MWELGESVCYKVWEGGGKWDSRVYVDVGSKLACTVVPRLERVRSDHPRPAAAHTHTHANTRTHAHPFQGSSIRCVADLGPGAVRLGSSVRPVLVDTVLEEISLGFREWWRDCIVCYLVSSEIFRE